MHSANASFFQTFQVNPGETQDKPLYELGNRQWDIPQLRRLLEEVLPTNHQLTDFEVEHNFETIGRRAMLLNARKLDHAQLSFWQSGTSPSAGGGSGSASCSRAS